MADEIKPDEPYVWLVTGESGEYADHSTWVLSAYADEAGAKARADALDSLVGELKKALAVVGKTTMGAMPGWHAAYCARAGDPFFSEEASYSVEPVQIVGAMPERVTGPAADLARLVMAWWEVHKYDTSGYRGERNVYDVAPDFVVAAEAVLAGTAQQDGKTYFMELHGPGGRVDRVQISAERAAAWFAKGMTLCATS